jgi:hypothetical protein
VSEVSSGSQEADFPVTPRLKGWVTELRMELRAALQSGASFEEAVAKSTRGMTGVDPDHNRWLRMSTIPDAPHRHSASGLVCGKSIEVIMAWVLNDESPKLPWRIVG